MKYIKIQITILLLFCFINGFTQNKYLDYKSALILSNSPVLYENVFYNNKNIKTFNKDAKYLNPTFAFQVKTKGGNFREIELTSFKLNNQNNRIVEYTDTTYRNFNTIGGFENRNLSLSLRLEHIKVFRKSSDKRLIPAIGYGIMPFIYHTSLLPKASVFYQTMSSNIGFSAFVCPRINYYFKNKLFLTLNLPLTIMSFEIENQKTDNPNIPLRNRSVTVFNFNSLNTNFYPRLGIGIKL